MAHKTLIAQIFFWLVVAVAVIVGAAEYEVRGIVPPGDNGGLLVSGTGSGSYVTSTTFKWQETLDEPAGLFSLCYSVWSNLGTPQVAIDYQVSPEPSAGYVNLTDSSGADIAEIVDDTSNIGGNGYYCIPGDYFPTWTNSIRLFPWGRLVFHGLGSNPTDTFMSNVWLIRY